MVTDQGLIVSRGPDYVPTVCCKIVEKFAKGEHEEQKRSAEGAGHRI